jgi:hypothetical protein
MLRNLRVALRLYFLFFATPNKCTRWYTEEFI